jgi:hypothetical protein
MAKNKCTLVCDANWLLISRFSVMGKGFEVNMPEITKQNAQKELHELMAKSINIVLNRFPIIDNIVIVSDGGSWRKQLPIPTQLEDTTYKGNRIQAKDHDWKYIYGALTDLSDSCRALGITVSNHSSIEGDDWAWYWSRRLNADGISCIIWTSDCDLKQLIQVDQGTLAFTAWYNDKNGIWFSDELKEKEVSDLEFFMQPIKVKSPLIESLKQYSRSTNYIDPDDIVMDKIICGDAGDNIKPVARVVRGSKTYKVTPKIWNEIKEELRIESINDFINKKYLIAQSITMTKKFFECNAENILEMIDYNIKLVWLNENVIPETIIMYMNQLEYNTIDLGYIKSNYKTICKSDNEIEDIFDSIM